MHGENFDSAATTIPTTTISAATLAAPANGGSLSLTFGPAPSSVDLTASGTQDWVHFGQWFPGTVDNKLTDGNQISDVTLLGSGATKTSFSASPTGFSWSDGLITPVTSGTTTGIPTSGIGSGFEFTAPAGTGLRVLNVYLGVSQAAGTLTAHLSDGSAVPVSGNSLSGTSGSVYTIVYRASSNQQLVIDWTETADLSGNGTGSINLEAATLSAPTVTQSIAGTAGNDTITVTQDPSDPSLLDTEVGGQVFQSAANLPITINGAGGTDTLVFNDSQPIANLNLIGAFATTGLTVNPGQGITLARVGAMSTSLNVSYSGASPLSAIQGYLRSGQLTSFGLPAGMALADIDDGSGVLLTPRVIGDLNGDSTVNFADLLRLVQDYGHSSGDWASGDLNYDSTVNFADVLLLVQHYGSTANASADGAASSLAGTLPGLTPLDLLKRGKRR